MRVQLGFKLFLYVFAIFAGLLGTGCDEPEQFPRVSEDTEKRAQYSKTNCHEDRCIALVSHSTLDVSYIEIGIDNHQRYAAKHGYDYIFRNNLISDYENGQFIDRMAGDKKFQLGLYWQKIVAVQDALHKKNAKGDFLYEFILWLDPDTLVTNLDTKLEELASQHGTDVLISQGSMTWVDAGIFLVRNTPWSRQMFQDLMQLYPHYRNKLLPEQLAMQDYMLGFISRTTDGKFHFQSEHTRHYANSPIQKVSILNQRALNAYYEGHPFMGSGPKIVWEPGDFIAHFAVVQDKKASMVELVRCFKRECGERYEDVPRSAQCWEICK